MADREVSLHSDNDKEKDYGVLLYYKYATIPDIQKLFDFYNSNCTSLALLGRVRISSNGVNVTIGGRMKALEKHIETVRLCSLFEGADFKLASCVEPLNDQVAKECGFTSLSIRIVKELVTLSPRPLLKSPEISNAGKHLSAAEFHSVLQNGKFQEVSSVYDRGLILLDARNLYETRIGKFDSPDVKTLDPEIRQHSDLPSWIDSNSEQLQGKNILMYCTGGIRCEMASAYIRSKGAGFENVFQLYGGIQRYMEQFSDGGFFKGKNFVFDHRVSVGSLDNNVLGTCLLCGAPFDDYTSRCRCTHCRMLVLICNSCQEQNSSYVCELCQKNGKPLQSISSIDDISEVLQPASHDYISCSNQALKFFCSTWSKGEHTAVINSSRKLRILCLHGFRQNASSFKGRTASLTKKLKSIAEFIFVDAPHEVPFIYQPPASDKNNDCQPSFSLQVPPLSHSNRRFAWLVAADYDRNHGKEWKVAEMPFDPLQHQQQTEGFHKSIEYLKTVFSQEGPVDGILGFSQGAAMAALVAADREKLQDVLDFRFVILCSGFPVNLAEYAEHSINLPSLHIYGSKEGTDKQIDFQFSRKLASFFHSCSSAIIEHDLGHIIPTKSPYIDKMKAFLGQFCRI